MIKNNMAFCAVLSKLRNSYLSGATLVLVAFHYKNSFLGEALI